MEGNRNEVAQAEKARLAETSKDIIKDLYIYAYPLVTMEMTRRIMTNTETSNGKFAPMGQFAKLREYPTSEDKEVTAPNADTLYTLAWLDLSNEPYILQVPDFNGRYFMLPMLSAWTNVFAVPGTRTTGTDAHTYALTGPGWSGTLPDNVKEIKAPTNIVWILGRIYCSGTEEDINEVHELQDQLILTPLSFYGKQYKAPSGKVDPSVNMEKAVRDQVDALSVQDYFNIFTKMLENNPPSKDDTSATKILTKLGIVPGGEFDINNLTDITTQELKEIPSIAQKEIIGYLKDATQLIDGWSVTKQTGEYGTQYLLRALVTAIGLGANRPEDAIYPVGKGDANGDIFNGSNKYVIHFEKDQFPPVKGFWSLTMYDSSYFFVDNEINRYTLSSRFDFIYNKDGSLDLYIQQEYPGKEKENNWLPAPKGDFILMFRFYWPDKSIINNKWTIPPVKKV
ncbi:MAG: DUF1254 domain-containing protein [Sporocytophaga sp.]|uniref:DUF1254 domain-containing protein n=1 Tax=Sporocytophaga sp. TaxID=2231183 RepID=UPI001B15B67A|nr:DUF1254 domain-containing protein [Sporocytophaga sp.]MBO9702716.1 DUF1254 domain-containing protein [Sporocytophaga sp.]